MKTLLLVFSNWLNKQFRLIDSNLSRDTDFIVEFMVCDEKDASRIIKYLENRDDEDNDEDYGVAYFRCLELYHITINEVLKFQQYHRYLYKYNDENFDENHDFIRLHFVDYIASGELIKKLYNFIKDEYKKYIVEHPIESIDYLKLDISEEDRISELIHQKIDELSFESISKLIEPKIDKLRTELLEVIEFKFKKLEEKINKYF